MFFRGHSSRQKKVEFQLFVMEFMFFVFFEKLTLFN